MDAQEAADRSEIGLRADADETATPALPADLAGLVVSIDHVGIAVPDLEKAVAFYAQTFGLVETHREVNAEQGVAEVMLRLPNPANPGTDIQLLAPLTSESSIARFIGRSGPGMQQLAFRVLDVVQVSASLRKKGLRLLYAEPRQGTNNSLINFVHPKDTGGVLIELVQAEAR